MPGYGNPPESGKFKPGRSGNPLGAALHNQELKMLRRMTKEDVAAIGQLILENNLEKLQAIKDDKNASVLKVWFASVAVKAISKGDAQALSVVLDRIIGKVKEQVHVTTGLDNMNGVTTEQAKTEALEILGRIQNRTNGQPTDI